MRLIYPPELRNFKEYKTSIKDDSKDEYRVISMPEFPEYKGVGIGNPSDVMCIASKSINKDLAWKALYLANGKEYAKHYISLNDKFSFTGGLISYFDEDIKNLLLKKYKFDFTPFYLNKGILTNKTQINLLTNSNIDIMFSNYINKDLRQKNVSKDRFNKLEQTINQYFKK